MPAQTGSMPKGDQARASIDSFSKPANLQYKVVNIRSQTKQPQARQVNRGMKRS